MKKCSTCQAVYADDALAFCLNDGTILQFVRDAEETLPAAYDPNATLAYPPVRSTQPTITPQPLAPPNRVVVPLRTDTNPPAPQQNFNTAPPTVVKQGVSPVVVGVLAGMLILAIGAAVAFALKDSWLPSAPVAGTASPTPTATQPPANDNKNAPAPPVVRREIVVVNQNNPAPAPTAPPAPADNDEDPANPPGRFPQTSTRSLRGDDLLNLSCGDLKIMRNEIFARHGFIFKTPDMVQYFSRQSWYRGTKSDVTRLLTTRERANLIVLKSHEQGMDCR